MSVPHSYSTVIVESPSRERDSTRRTRASEVTAASSGTVTRRSTSSACTSGYWVTTVSRG